MFLESLLHASIRNRRQPSLLPLNARAGWRPEDRRSVESAAPLRPSLRPRSGAAPLAPPHGAGSLSLLQARSKRIGTHLPSRTAQRLSPGLHPAVPMRDGWQLKRCAYCRASPTLGRFRDFLAGSGKFEGRQTRSAPNRGCFHLQRRESAAPASDSTSRTKSACRDKRCLAQTARTCIYGVEPTLVSPAAKFVMQAPSERSCRGQNGRRGSRGSRSTASRPRSRVASWPAPAPPARQDLLRGRQRGYAR